jgi:hypothetical protein
MCRSSQPTVKLSRGSDHSRYERNTIRGTVTIIRMVFTVCQTLEKTVEERRK